MVIQGFEWVCCQIPDSFWESLSLNERQNWVAHLGAALCQLVSSFMASGHRILKPARRSTWQPNDSATHWWLVEFKSFWARLWEWFYYKLLGGSLHFHLWAHLVANPILGEHLPLHSFEVGKFKQRYIHMYRGAVKRIQELDKIHPREVCCSGKMFTGGRWARIFCSGQSCHF